jgi:hypothetical protein
MVKNLVVKQSRSDHLIAEEDRHVRREHCDLAHLLAVESGRGSGKVGKCVYVIERDCICYECKAVEEMMRGDMGIM